MPKKHTGMIGSNSQSMKFPRIGSGGKKSRRKMKASLNFRLNQEIGINEHKPPKKPEPKIKKYCYLPPVEPLVEPLGKLLEEALRMKTAATTGQMGCTQEMKDWFGQGEYDVDLMLRMGAVTEDQIVWMWNNFIDSPGNKKP